MEERADDEPGDEGREGRVEIDGGRERHEARDGPEEETGEETDEEHFDDERCHDILSPEIIFNVFVEYPIMIPFIASIYKRLVALFHVCAKDPKTAAADPVVIDEVADIAEEILDKIVENQDAEEKK
jgi:hypothetical protein